MQRHMSRYPRSGRIALLCEGDLVGYEADLLERWTATELSFLVDVWPCGTKTAIYGLSDAIGRDIPIVVVEDRDHRSVKVAETDCEGKLKDRKRRGVDVRFWRAWQRNEIENYLIEPDVACPVLTEVFGVEPSVVSELLQEVLMRTAVDQALQHALAAFRDAFPQGEKDVGGVPRREGRPSFTAGRLNCPDSDKVGELLEKVLNQALKKLDPEKRPDSHEFKELFYAKSEEWGSMDINNLKWRTDWAGKEVLYWLRICLSGRYGWPNQDGVRTPVEWDNLSREKSGEMDRAIEKAIQPRLVKEFLRQMSAASDESFQGVVEEWGGITHGIETVLSVDSAE